MKPLRKYLPLLTCGLAISLPIPAGAVAKLFDGNLEINGVQLLQDSEDRNTYYYVPPYPVLGRNADGSYALSFIQYMGASDGKNGGVLNAVVEMRLPEDVLDDIRDELSERYGARLIGPVQFTDPADDVVEGVSKSAQFRVVMATVGKPGSNTLSAGAAPIGSGGRTVIAASLSSDDAALLWGALQVGSFNDVAFEMSAAYLAKIEAYNAVVEAEMETIYTHFSDLQNNQAGFTRDQVRDVVDELTQSQVLSVTEADSGRAFDITSGNAEALVQTITEKLIETMFDTEAGWSRPVEMETSGDGEIEGRIEGGTISGSFFGIPGLAGGSVGYEENTAYVPDDQHVLKNREEIRRNTFRLDLSRSQVIRVPYQSTGNVGSLFVHLSGDSRYFQTIDLGDSARSESVVRFSVQGGYQKAFDELLDSVSIDVQYGMPGNEQRVSHRLSSEAIKGTSLGFPEITIKKPLSGDTSGWDSYSYRVSWNVRGSPEPIVQPSSDGWTIGGSLAPSLAPPLQQSQVEVFFDPSAFGSDDVRAVIVDVMSYFRGKARILRTLHMIPGDEFESLRPVICFHDPGSTLLSRVTYVTPEGRSVGRPAYIESGFVYVGAMSAD